jgi:hypothetical protein
VSQTEEKEIMSLEKFAGMKWKYDQAGKSLTEGPAPSV